MKRFLLYCCTCVLFSLQTYAGSNPISRFETVQKGFIENKGQVKDQNGKVNEDVKFIYSDNLFHLQLRKEGFSYELFRVTKTPIKFPESGREDGTTGERDESNDNFKISTSRVDVILKGANSHFQIRGREESEAYYNYYLNTLPSYGITEVKSFNEVVYENVYPGIDMIFTASSDDEPGLKYEFIVHPGADPKQIRLEYRGVSNMQIDSCGNLELKNRLGEVRETGLCCYLLQSNQAVPFKVLLKGNTVSFDLRAIKDQTIVIDPNIVWGTYYGGEMIEDIYPEIALNKSNNVILTGVTESLTSIATTGAYQTYFGGETDAFIAKFNVSGKLLWATYLGGDDADASASVTVDRENNIIIGGDAESKTGIATAGAHQETNAGGKDGIIAKFSSSGIIEWCTYFGASKKDQLRNVTCDTAGNIYASGVTLSPSGIATPGAYQVNYAGLRDILVVKFSASGELQWSTYYGGAGEDRPHGMTTDLQSNIYLEGTTESAGGIASSNGYQQQYGGHTDACLAKFNAGGQLIWGTYYGGALEDHGRAPITDALGNVYIDGFTNSTSSFATTGAYQETNGGGNDGFIAKFSPSGNRLWGSYYGGARGEQLVSIAIDKEANIYLGGSATSDSLSTPDAFQSQLSDTLPGDGLLIKMDSAGKRIWATYFGGNGQEKIYDVASDPKGFVYFVLYDSNSVIPISPWVSQTHNNGMSDLAVYKFYQGHDCYDYNEPDDSLASARLIKTVTDSSIYGYNGSISSSTDKDYYKVKIIPNAPNLKIELRDLTRNYNLQLLGPQGQVLQESNNPGTSDESIILNGAVKSKYYVSITHDLSQFDSLNCYRLLALNSANPFKQTNNFTEEESGYTELVVSPSPATNQLQISFNSSTTGEATVTIYNVIQQPVKSESLYLVEGNFSAIIDLPNLSSGTYFLELKQGKQVFIRKIMIIN